MVNCHICKKNQAQNRCKACGRLVCKDCTYGDMCALCADNTNNISTQPAKQGICKKLEVVIAWIWLCFSFIAFGSVFYTIVQLGLPFWLIIIVTILPIIGAYLLIKGNAVGRIILLVCSILGAVTFSTGYWGNLLDYRSIVPGVDLGFTVLYIIISVILICNIRLTR